MSRIGKAPVSIPAGVEVTLNGRDLAVKGSKGKLSFVVPHEIDTKIENNEVTFAPKREGKQFAAKWGLTRAMTANMVTGVTDGYEIKLKLIGVGYRANMAGPKLNIAVGYSHPVLMDVPAGLTVATPEPTEIVINGIDKQAVGQFAANVRAKRPPEPFKGKGIRYADEHINMKEGKKK